MSKTVRSVTAALIDNNGSCRYGLHQKSWWLWAPVYSRYKATTIHSKLLRSANMTLHGKASRKLKTLRSDSPRHPYVKMDFEGEHPRACR